MRVFPMRYLNLHPGRRAIWGHAYSGHPVMLMAMTVLSHRRAVVSSYTCAMTKALVPYLIVV